MPTTRRRTIRSVHAIPVVAVGECRCAENVLGARNVHARILGEEAVGFEEDIDVLHGHTAKPKGQQSRL